MPPIEDTPGRPALQAEPVPRDRFNFPAISSAPMATRPALRGAPERSVRYCARPLTDRRVPLAAKQPALVRKAPAVAKGLDAKIMSMYGPQSPP